MAAVVVRGPVAARVASLVAAAALGVPPQVEGLMVWSSLNTEV
jgi:hypothetical protein